MRRHVWSLPVVARCVLLSMVLATASCARRDWVSDLLVLTDVTGTWEGWVKGAGFGGPATTPSDPITMVLQQTGPKVTGQLRGRVGRGWWRVL
jgi:hypothetical protein